MFGYISALEATVKWGIGILERWVQKLCEVGRILGVAKFSRMWLIPKDARKLIDERIKGRKEKVNETAVFTGR